jgi:hypothetical protein
MDGLAIGGWLGDAESNRREEPLCFDGFGAKRTQKWRFWGENRGVFAGWFLMRSRCMLLILNKLYV